MSEKKVYDAFRNTTKSAKEYEVRWCKHIRELQSVFLEAGVPYDEWDKELGHLEEHVRTATDNLVKDGCLTDDR